MTSATVPHLPPVSPVDDFRVVIVEPSLEDAYRLVEALSQSEDVFQVEHRDSFVGALQAVEANHVDLVIVDVACLASSSVEGSMLRLATLRPQVPVVLVCNERDQELAFLGVRAGAHDYLVRGADDADTVLRTVQSALQRRSSATKLHFMAHHDGLTGLANRGLFETCLQECCERSTTTPVVLYLDLDGFKPINDTHGHDAGDEVLRVVAQRIRKAVRGLDVVARMGGDEFAVLLDGTSNSRGVAVGHRIITAIEQPIALDNDVTVTVSCSMGLSSGPCDAPQSGKLIQQADQAMYEAKRAGRGRLHVHTHDDALASPRRPSLQHELRDAVAAKAFEVFYQSQVDATGACIGVEALLRWPRSQEDWTPPATFVPMLETMGLIGEVGLWVLDRALAQLRAWQQSHRDIPRISVNVSPLQLKDPRFASHVQGLLDMHAVPARSLELEVTEGLLLADDEQSNATLRALQQLGVRMALDDFGTGYASLATLYRHRVDTIKLDQSFIHGMEPRNRADSIVASVLDLGRRLNVTVIAEGVETEAQATQLRDLGCAAMQGYLFDKPRPAADI